MRRALPMIVALLLACEPGPGARPPPPMGLVGARARLATAPKAVFDAQRPPIIRVDGPLSSKLKVMIAGPRGERRVSFDVHTRSAGTFLHLPVDTLPTRGEGHVQVRVRGHAHRTWPVRWSTPPEAHPAVRGVRQAPTLAAARAALTPEAEPWVRAAAHAALAERAGQREAWTQAGAAALEAGVISVATNAWRQAARLALAAHDLAEVHRLLERAEAVDRGSGHAAGRGAQLHLRGRVAHHLGELHRAETFYRAALAHARQHADFTTEARLLGDLAELLVDLAQPHRALTAGALPRATVDPRARAQALAQLGWAHLHAIGVGRSTHARARVALARARQAWIDVVDVQAEIRTTLEQALLEHLAGAPVAAAKLLAEARALGADARPPLARLATLVEAHLALADDRLHTAEHGYRRITEAGDAAPDLTWRGHLGLARVAEARGDAALGLRHLARARDERRRVVDRLGLVRRRLPPPTDLVALATRLAATQHQMAEAFVTLNDAQAAPVRAQAALASVAALKAAPRAERRALVAAYLRARDAFTASRAELDALSGPSRAAWQARRLIARTRLAERFDAVALAPPPARATAVTLAQALGAGEALVAFTQLGDAVHAFRLTPDGVVRHKRSALGADLLGDWHPARTGDAHLYVVPGRVPEASRLTREGVPPLGTVAGVSTLPFAGLLPHLDRAPRGRPVLVLDPQGEAPADAPAPPFARHWPDAHRLRGPAATRAALLSRASDARLLHLATPCPRPEGAEAPRLELAQGTRLTAADLLAERLRLGTVVLTGCTATPGGGPLDVPTALLVAGARSVVATHRPVTGAAADQFLTVFYGAGGDTRPGVALQKAVADAHRRGDPAWRAFYLVGRP